MPVAQPSADVAKRSAQAFVVLMGIVAMFGDMTYEGARGLVGPYLGLLGVSAVGIGFIAGFGEFLGYALRLASGWLGDRTRWYWPIVFVGYSLNGVVVVGLALVTSWQAAVALVLLERIGKALRSPARSTLVSHAASQVGVGRGFGIDEALDQIGAVAGPLLTALALWWFRSEPAGVSYRFAFAVLLLPVVGNLVVLAVARKRYPAPENFEPASTPSLVPSTFFRRYVLVASLMALGFSDWAFLAFHASKTGLVDVGLVPVLYAVVMGLDGVAALLFGLWFDRRGLVVLAMSTAFGALFAPLVFFSSSGWVLLAGVACWAVSLGAQESVFKAAIAQHVPKAQRARAYGVFFAVFGFAWWVGSTLMGWLYERSVVGLVAFSVVTQLIAAGAFVVMARPKR